uniref:Coiled-coil domain-containing protein 51 n=1 Tax=Strongyloides stercoralis TaxID=6248 RepID=A0AAF5D654_STRER
MNKGFMKLYLTSKYLVDCRHFSSSQVLMKHKYLDKAQSQIELLYSKYEDVMGMTKVKKIQDDVIEIEKSLNSAQMRRRGLQQELDDLRLELKKVAMEMERTPRSDDAYLKLVTQEHALFKKEIPLQKEFNVAEEYERTVFGELSRRIRHAHEKERERIEKTRFISLLTTVTVAGIGIFSSVLNNYLKDKRYKEVYGDVKELLFIVKSIFKENGELQINYDLGNNKIGTFEEKLEQFSKTNNVLIEKIDFIKGEVLNYKGILLDLAKNYTDKISTKSTMQNVSTNSTKETVNQEEGKNSSEKSEEFSKETVARLTFGLIVLIVLGVIYFKS